MGGWETEMRGGGGEEEECWLGRKGEREERWGEKQGGEKRNGEQRLSEGDIQRENPYSN